jgi:hypothetical protein
LLFSKTLPASRRLLWIACILLVACGQSAAGLPPEAAPDPDPEVVIVGDTDGYPEGCHPRDVADRVLSFFAAYNAGDTAALDEAFSTTIEWYSDTKEDVLQDGEQVRLHFVTYEREGIFPYLALRHAQQDRLRLLWLNVGPRSWHGGVDISYALRRQAGDLAPGPDGATRIGMGKGAVRCPGAQIFVWSMATAPAWEEEAAYAGGGCAREATPPGAVVVCARVAW